MSKPRLVMVGNGMAGVRTLEELFKLDAQRWDVTVFGAEPHPNYNRIMLSPVLAGEQTLAEIILNPLDWYARHGITLHLGKPVVAVDRERRTVTAADGTSATYDVLLLATGSLPFVPPVPGRELDGVISYRDIADTQRMIDTARTHRHAVVVGGGLLGLEAANGLAQRGMDVTVVHLNAWVLDRQLDVASARLLQGALEARGIRFRLGAQTQALLGDGQGRVRAIRFADGSEQAADLVVMAAGVRPNTALAEQIGLAVNRGIVVDDALQTSDPSIRAVGECVNHRGVSYGLVAPLFEQAQVLAAHLADPAASAAYQGSQTATKLKVTGIDLYSAGDFMGGDGCEQILLNDPVAPAYKKLVLRDGRLVGACLYGDTADGAWYLRLIREGTPVAALRSQLMFGEPRGAAHA